MQRGPTHVGLIIEVSNDIQQFLTLGYCLVRSVCPMFHGRFANGLAGRLLQRSAHRRKMGRRGGVGLGRSKFWAAAWNKSSHVPIVVQLLGGIRFLPTPLVPCTHNLTNTTLTPYPLRATI